MTIISDYYTLNHESKQLKMEKTFEVIERYTLSQFHDYHDSSQPAKFTQGIHRDINCARLAEQLIKRNNGNDKPLGWELYLIFLDDDENCIGVKSIRPTTENGFTGLNLRLIFSLCIASKAKKVLFLVPGYDDLTKGIYPAKNFRKFMKMVECEFVELRHVGKNGEVIIQDGKEE